MSVAFHSQICCKRIPHRGCDCRARSHSINARSAGAPCSKSSARGLFESASASGCSCTVAAAAVVDSSCSAAPALPVSGFSPCARALLGGGSVDLLPTLVGFIPSSSGFGLALRPFIISVTVSVASLARPCGNVPSSTASPIHTSPDLLVASKRSGPSRRRDITSSCVIANGRILGSHPALERGGAMSCLHGIRCINSRLFCRDCM